MCVCVRVRERTLMVRGVSGVDYCAVKIYLNLVARSGCLFVLWFVLGHVLPTPFSPPCVARLFVFLSPFHSSLLRAPSRRGR